jgi:outer membrane protein assembly factor BamB
MPDWSRRTLLRAGGGVGLAGVLGGGWYLRERPFCRPRVDARWTYHGEYCGPVVPTEHGVLVAEGRGVTGGSDHRLALLDRGTGQTRWTSVAEGGGFGVPTVSDGRVYVGTGLDTVRALDVATGADVWTYDPGGVEEYGGGAWGRPLVVDDRVYVGVSHADDPDVDPSDGSQFTHEVVALDAADGAELWSTGVTAQVWAGPVLVADTLVVGTEDAVLNGFDPATGDVRWSVDLPGGLRHRPLVADDGLTLVADDGTAVFVDVSGGTIRRTEALLAGATVVAREGDTLYVGGESGRVVALPVTPSPDLTTWPVAWTYEAGVRVGALAAGAAGSFVVDQSGHLHRVTDDGERDTRLRLVDREWEDRCGWRPDREYVTGAVLNRRGVVVASRWWVRSFGVDAV